METIVSVRHRLNNEQIMNVCKSRGKVLEFLNTFISKQDMIYYRKIHIFNKWFNKGGFNTIFNNNLNFFMFCFREKKTDCIWRKITAILIKYIELDSLLFDAIATANVKDLFTMNLNITLV